jgi:hypothetical protein
MIGDFQLGEKLREGTLLQPMNENPVLGDTEIVLW